MTSKETPWRLKSPTIQRFIQPFVKANIKEHIKSRDVSESHIVCDMFAAAARRP